MKINHFLIVKIFISRIVYKRYSSLIPHSMMNAYLRHVSVDCVLFGFDGTNLHTLLVEKTGVHEGNNMKLPGRLIHENEDLETAASNIVEEMTGIKRSNLHQFKAFGAPDRTSNPNDRAWLEYQVSMDIDRVVTVGFMSTFRISTKLKTFSTVFNARWVPVNSTPKLIFDHNLILQEAVEYLRQMAQWQPAIIFKLLPPKFTALQLRKIYETITGIKIDARNFHKKISSMPYVKVLDETQTNVSHRAAHYYKFDKRIYNRMFGQL